MHLSRFFAALTAPVLPCVAEAKPNIIFVMADDLGYGDPRCYQPASKIPTPHMDRLAGEGMRFTDAHTPSAVLSTNPTRSDPSKTQDPAAAAISRRSPRR